MIDQTFLCKLHPDFHLPAGVEVGLGFDGEMYARRLKDSGVDAVVCFAKCHYGHSYYYTNIGFRHPGLQTDMLAETARGCRAHGLGVIAYYSVFLDTAAATQHPEWIPRTATGAAEIGYDSQNFLPVCVNSAYVEELLLPQSREVATQYDVDELFFDTMTMFRPCFCENCRTLFGKPIPLDERDGNWLPYVRWYYDQYERFFAKVAGAIYACKPTVAVTFNWKWALALPALPAPHITRLAGDLIPSATVASINARYWAGTGYPFEYMCGRFLHGLGDWSNNTPVTLQSTAASTIANGGNFYLIDRQLPDGSLEERAYPLVKEVFDFVQQRRTVVAGTTPIPETAVLCPFEHVVGPKLEYFPHGDVREQRIRPFTGVAKLLMTQARHYTAFNTENLLTRLQEHRLVILPELEYVDKATVTALTHFVEDGGTVLIVQGGSETALDARLSALAGVCTDGLHALDYGYIDHQTAGFDDPILVRGHFARVTPLGDTEIRCGYVPPMAYGHKGVSFGHGDAPPTHPDGTAVVTRRQLGRGVVLYVAAPIFSSFDTFRNTHLATWVVGLLDDVLPAPMVRVTTAAPVEMTAMRKGDDLIIHLVNHSAREWLANHWCPIIEYMPTIHNIAVAVKRRDALETIFAAPDMSAMKTTIHDDYLHFHAAPLHIMSSYLAPGYFV